MKTHTPAQRARNNKARGKTLERDAVKLAISLGFSAQRGWGSDGRAMGEHQEVDVKIADKKFQCKRKVKFPDWLQRNGVVDGHIIRQDSDVAMVLLPLEDYLDMWKELKALSREVETLRNIPKVQTFIDAYAKTHI